MCKINSTNGLQFKLSVLKYTSRTQQTNLVNGWGRSSNFWLCPFSRDRVSRFWPGPWALESSISCLTGGWHYDSTRNFRLEREAMMKFLEVVLVCHHPPAPPACCCHAQSGKIFLMRGSHCAVIHKSALVAVFIIVSGVTRFSRLSLSLDLLTDGPESRWLWNDHMRQYLVHAWRVSVIRVSPEYCLWCDSWQTDLSSLSVMTWTILIVYWDRANLNGLWLVKMGSQIWEK